MHVGVRWAIVGVGLAVALAPQPLSAQDTTVVDSLPRRKAGHFHLGLTVHDYGVSFGNAARVSGIRLNVQDAELERVNGINVTLWKPQDPMSCVVNGIQAGVLPGSESVNGVALGVAGVVTERRQRWLSVGGLGVVSNRSMEGVAVSGLGTVANRDIAGLAVAGLGTVANRNIHGIAIAGLGTVANGEVAGVALGGLATVANGRFSGVGVGGLAVVTNGALRGVGVGGLATVANGSIAGAGIGGLAVVTDGRLTGLGIGGLAVVADQELRGINTDSRSVQPGEVFVKVYAVSEAGDGVQARCPLVALEHPDEHAPDQPQTEPEGEVRHLPLKVVVDEQGEGDHGK